MNDEFKEIEQLIQQPDVTNQEVSQRSVYWQLDHALRTVYGIAGLLADSNPEEYQWKFNKLRLAVWLKGSIPRGKGKAPKKVITDAPVSQEQLVKMLAGARKKMEAVPDLPAKSNFQHPYFGQLNKKKTLWFIKLHTEHHLKIVRDIVRK